MVYQRQFILNLGVLFISTACMSTNRASNVLVFGGQEVVDPSDPVYQSTVSILMNYEGQKLSLCTGTVISPQLVVSSAHCFADFSGDKLWVGFGQDPRAGELFEVTHVAYPAAYYTANALTTGIATYQYDVALLATKQTLSSPLKAVPISNAKDPTSEGLLQAGYGYSDRIKGETRDDLSYPMYGKLRKVSGKTLVQSSEIPQEMRSPLNQDPWVLTSNSGKGADTQGGDSGGPLYHLSDKGLILLGNLRGGSEYRMTDEGYSHYTNLAHYQTWLNCAAASTPYPLPVPLVPSEGVDQMPCEKDAASPIGQLFSRNRKLCQSIPGFDIKPQEGSSCWPATAEACRKLGLGIWNETTATCE